MAMILIHYTNETTFDVNRRYSQEIAKKPNGLWLSVGESYKIWSLGNRSIIDNLSNKFIFDVNMSRIAPVDCFTGVAEFDSLYGKSSNDSEIHDLVDWEAVTNRYNGAIFYPYSKLQYFDTHSNGWYNSINSASACVWDLRCLKLKEIILGV
jgi:hypothetical protein